MKIWCNVAAEEYDEFDTIADFLEGYATEGSDGEPCPEGEVFGTFNAADVLYAIIADGRGGVWYHRPATLGDSARMFSAKSQNQ